VAVATPTSDAIVVGAGIVGAAIAFRLAEHGLRVRVLEAAEAPATGSTGRSAAGVRVQFGRETNVRLSWASIEEYRTFEERYGASSGYRPQGYLFLVPEEAWPGHAQAVALQRRLGVPVEELSPQEAQAHVPFDPDGVHRTTFGPADGVVDPHAIATTYLRLARERGAMLHLATPLESARHEQGVWRVGTPTGTFEAPLVVNAAGAWAGRVAASAGLTLPVQPLRRMVFVTGPTPHAHAYPLTIDVASGAYLRSEGRRILFGRSNPDERPGFLEGVDWDWLEPTLEAALGRFRFLAEVGLDRRASWWGYYEVTPDHDAILGRHPDAEGWIDAAGFSGHGVQHAAMVGRLIAEEAVDGRAWTLDLDPLRHARFGAGAAAAETHIV
jgi:sarcosine oxidase subunit beta